MEINPSFNSLQFTSRQLPTAWHQLPEPTNILKYVHHLSPSSSPAARRQPPVSLHLDRIDRTNLPAGIALDAKLGVDYVFFVGLERDCIDRATLDT